MDGVWKSDDDHGAWPISKTAARHSVSSISSGAFGDSEFNLRAAQRRSAVRLLKISKARTVTARRRGH